MGYSRAAEEYIDRINDNPQWGYAIRGILDDNVEAGTIYKGIKVLGTIANLEVILPENKLDEIAIKNTCRISLSFYNTREEVDLLINDFYPGFTSDFANNIRTDDKNEAWWITVHNSTYDIQNRSFKIFVQEDYEHSFEFKI